MWEAITGSIKFLGELFGFINTREQELNTPKMQANKEAEVDLRNHEKNVKDTLDGNLDALRKHPLE